MLRNALVLLAYSTALPIQPAQETPAPSALPRLIKFHMLDSRTGKELYGHLRVYTDPTPLNHTHEVSTTFPQNTPIVLEIPGNVMELSAYGTGNDSWGFANCDSNKDHPWKEHTYSVAKIMSTGVVAPNHCNHKQATAAPGEFVFFVRHLTFWEKFQV